MGAGLLPGSDRSRVLRHPLRAEPVAAPSARLLGNREQGYISGLAICGADLNQAPTNLDERLALVICALDCDRIDQ